MMTRMLPVAGMIGALVFGATAAQSQNAVDEALMAQGSEIYGTACAMCHQPAGQGMPPAFPALAGNDYLANLDSLVGTIRDGREAMPPFSYFSDEELAAVITYIRNSWGNDFGGVSVDEVALLSTDQDEVTRLSVWDGIYTDEQAERGQAIYIGQCAMCHGSRLDGAADDPDQRNGPALARARMIRSWNGQSVASLFEYTRSTMPDFNPGSLSGQQTSDILAYMFQVSNMPSGDEELTDSLALLGRIIIEPDPR